MQVQHALLQALQIRVTALNGKTNIYQVVIFLQQCTLHFAELGEKSKSFVCMCAGAQQRQATSLEHEQGCHHCLRTLW